MEKILMIIAPQNFQEQEYSIPKQIFEDNDYIVVTASKDVDIAISHQGNEVSIDRYILGLRPDEYEAVILVGGVGTLIYQNDEDLKDVLVATDEYEILIGAICIAPTILAYYGILNGKNATVWNGNGQQQMILQQFGANYTGRTVEQDKHIITANGPESAQEFALKIIDYLDKR